MAKRGFTLMEMMIVVVAVSVLSAIGFAVFNNMKEKAANREAKAILQLIQVAERNYIMEHGTYFPVVPI